MIIYGRVHGRGPNANSIALYLRGKARRLSGRAEARRDGERLTEDFGMRGREERGRGGRRGRGWGWGWGCSRELESECVVHCSHCMMSDVGEMEKNNNVDAFITERGEREMRQSARGSLIALEVTWALALAPWPRSAGSLVEGTLVEINSEKINEKKIKRPTTTGVALAAWNGWAMGHALPAKGQRGRHRH